MRKHRNGGSCTKHCHQSLLPQQFVGGSRSSTVQLLRRPLPGICDVRRFRASVDSIATCKSLGCPSQMDEPAKRHHRSRLAALRPQHVAPAKPHQLFDHIPSSSAWKDDSEAWLAVRMFEDDASLPGTLPELVDDRTQRCSPVLHRRGRVVQHVLIEVHALDTLLQPGRLPARQDPAAKIVGACQSLLQLLVFEQLPCCLE
mmetsp:Transcript_110635/g.263742  ORF Transcript_110635/g.263742 Transcript_110635/m.263742 type:complete len:201 (+) Transcript_110635:158-760(+)